MKLFKLILICALISPVLASAGPVRVKITGDIGGCSEKELILLAKEYDSIRRDFKKNEAEIVKATHAGNLKARNKGVLKRKKFRAEFNAVIDDEIACVSQGY